MAIVAVSKFTGGAWLVVIMIPLLVALMWAIHVHYRRLELAVAPRSSARVTVPARSPLVIVPIARLDQPSLDAVAFARSIAPDALAVHITNDPDAAAELRQHW